MRRLRTSLDEIDALIDVIRNVVLDNSAKHVKQEQIEAMERIAQANFDAGRTGDAKVILDAIKVIRCDNLTHK